jgi:imidazolonepropionase-like amidohydrolase
MKRSLRIFLYAAIVATVPIQFAQQAPTPTPGTIAIQHATVIDVATGGRAADQTVVISGSRITAAGPSAKVKTPAGARVVDGTGKFLIPGLWDAHIHAIHVKFETTLPIAVARGITDARDMGAPVSYLVRARKAIDQGLLTPRLFVSGAYLDGEAAALNDLFPPEDEVLVKTSEEARQLVDQLAALKVDFIKVHNGLKRDVYLTAADEAKRKGLMFVGHLQPGVDIVEASDLGQRTIEHMNGLQAACVANPADLKRQAPNTPAPTGPIQID